MARDKTTLLRPIPFASTSTGKRGSEIERDHAAMVLAGYITGMLHFDPECISEHFRDGLTERLNKLRQAQGIDKAVFVREAATRICQAAE
jgi:hypothetical protein